MPCYYPLTARKTLQGEIVFKKRNETGFVSNLQLPCGRCIGCRIETQRQWTLRCVHETKLHERNCALTLTYASESNYNALPQDSVRPHQDVWTAEKSAREFSTIAPEALNGAKIAHMDNSRSYIREVELSIKDHQQFLKKLRERTKTKMGFYMCGEYGDKLLRPHYHYLLFGYDFPDKKYWKLSLNGSKLYVSKLLTETWGHGHAWIGEATEQTAAYIAGYVTKKITGPKAEEHYRRTDEAGNDYWLQPEFGLMSRNPAIGKGWYERFHQDVSTKDAVIQLGGVEVKPPRYYDKLRERRDPEGLTKAKQAREERAKEKANDNTPQRLRAKELVQIARLNMKKRQLEK